MYEIDKEKQYMILGVNTKEQLIELHNYLNQTSIYKLFLTSDVIKINEINITYIDTEYTCDTFFPKLNENKFYFVSKKKHEVNNISNNKTKCIYDIIYKSY